MPYNVGDIAAAVQDDLGDASFSLTRIYRYIDRGQQHIFNTHMFRFSEKFVSGALTVGKYAFDQQPDHQATIGGALVDETIKSTVFLLSDETRLESGEFFERYPDPATNPVGVPAAWTEYGDELLFNCPVDKAYTLRQRYYCEAPELSSPAQVPVVPRSFRSLLEDYAKAKAEKYRGNHDVGATYMQDFEDGLETMNLRYIDGLTMGPIQVPQPNRVWVSE